MKIKIPDAERPAIEAIQGGATFPTRQELVSHLKRVKSGAGLQALARCLNWDDASSEDVLDWVLAQPNCDVGTAVMIYWLNTPQEFKELEVSDPEAISIEGRAYELHRSLEQRLLEKHFKTGLVKFDPRESGYLPVRPEDESPEEARIPNALKEATLGKPWSDFEIVSPEEAARRRVQRTTAECVSRHLPEIAQRIQEGQSRSEIAAWVEGLGEGAVFPSGGATLNSHLPSEVRLLKPIK